MPHITTHTFSLSTAIREGGKVKVWHCALAVFLVGVAVGYLLAT